MASTDTFQKYSESVAGPYRHGATVTPDDSTDLSAVSRALFVGTSGSLAVVMAGGTSTATISFSSIPAGTLLPIRVSRVLLTGSSNTTGIVSLW